jgi:hypothetical protein
MVAELVLPPGYRNRAPAGLGLHLRVHKALPNKAYWLHARIVVPAYPKQAWLDEAADKQGALFIADMNRMGWAYIDRGIWIANEPISRTPITGAPSIEERERFVAKDAIDKARQGDRLRLKHDTSRYVTSVFDTSEVEEWEYDIKAAFWRETILVETPDEHEEREVLLR